MKKGGFPMRKKFNGKKFFGFSALLCAFSLMVLSFPALAASGDAENSVKKIRLDLVISGGAGYWLKGPGDLDQYRISLEKAVADLPSAYYSSKSFDWKKPVLQTDFSAEILVRFGRYFGIGLGTGYLRGTSNGRYSTDYHYSYSYSYYSTYREDSTRNYTQDYKITAVPIKLDFYFFLPLGKSERVSLFAHVAPGYYFGKLRHDYNYQADGEYQWGSSKYAIDSGFKVHETATCNVLGISGGLGLRMKIFSHMSLGAEIYGRRVNFQNWEGDYTEQWDDESGYEGMHGYLYTYEIKNSLDGRKTYTYMYILEDDIKKNNNIQNVKKTSLNLNAFGLLLSVNYSF